MSGASKSSRRVGFSGDWAPGQWRAGATIDPALLERLQRPRPRIALGRALGGVATACIDISDGVFADLGHVCAASGVAARLDVDALPGRAALHPHMDDDAARAKRGVAIARSEQPTDAAAAADAATVEAFCRASDRGAAAREIGGGEDAVEIFVRAFATTRAHATQPRLEAVVLAHLEALAMRSIGRTWRLQGPTETGAATGRGFPCLKAVRARPVDRQCHPNGQKTMCRQRLARPPVSQLYLALRRLRSNRSVDPSNPASRSRPTRRKKEPKRDAFAPRPGSVAAINVPAAVPVAPIARVRTTGIQACLARYRRHRRSSSP